LPQSWRNEIFIGAIFDEHGGHRYFWSILREWQRRNGCRIPDRSLILPDTADDKSWLMRAGHPSNALPTHNNPDETSQAAPVETESQWPAAPSLPAPRRYGSGVRMGVSHPGLFVFGYFVRLGIAFGAFCGLLVVLLADSEKFWLFGFAAGGVIGLAAGALNGIILGIYVAICRLFQGRAPSFCAQSIRWLAPLITTVIVMSVIRFPDHGISHISDLLKTPTFALYLLAALLSWIIGNIIATKLNE